MSAKLDDVRSMNQMDKDVINNYLRTIRNQFPLDKAYYDAPPIVIHWCLLYYAIRFPFRFEYVDCIAYEYPVQVDLRTFHVYLFAYINLYKRQENIFQRQGKMTQN